MIYKDNVLIGLWDALSPQHLVWMAERCRIIRWSLPVRKRFRRHAALSWTRGQRDLTDAVGIAKELGLAPYLCVDPHDVGQPDGDGFHQGDLLKSFDHLQSFAAGLSEYMHAQVGTEWVFNFGNELEVMLQPGIRDGGQDAIAWVEGNVWPRYLEALVWLDGFLPAGVPITTGGLLPGGVTPKGWLSLNEYLVRQKAHQLVPRLEYAVHLNGIDLSAVESEVRSLKSRVGSAPVLVDEDVAVILSRSQSSPDGPVHFDERAEAALAGGASHYAGFMAWWEPQWGVGSSKLDTRFLGVEGAGGIHVPNQEDFHRASVLVGDFVGEDLPGDEDELERRLDVILDAMNRFDADHLSSGPVQRQFRTEVRGPFRGLRKDLLEALEEDPPPGDGDGDGGGGDGGGGGGGGGGSDLVSLEDQEAVHALLLSTRKCQLIRPNRKKTTVPWIIQGWETGPLFEGSGSTLAEAYARYVAAGGLDRRAGGTLSSKQQEAILAYRTVGSKSVEGPPALRVSGDGQLHVDYWRADGGGSRGFEAKDLVDALEKLKALGLTA